MTLPESTRPETRRVLQDPPLQNIPIRTALGKAIRRAFKSPTNSVLLNADYSQLELNILAHWSKS